MKKIILETFSVYFQLGLHHIADFDGYDHMLFILALVCIYRLFEAVKVLVLVTAFTVGHSLTLFLATTRVVTVNGDWIEFLIPVTILITAVTNIARSKDPARRGMFWPYLYAAVFGLIHGLGFSNYLRMLLTDQGELFIPLLAFNIGIEVGQVAVVVCIFVLYEVAHRAFRFRHRDWILTVSAAVAGMSLILIKEAVFW